MESLASQASQLKRELEAMKSVQAIAGANLPTHIYTSSVKKIDKPYTKPGHLGRTTFTVKFKEDGVKLFFVYCDTAPNSSMSADADITFYTCQYIKKQNGSNTVNVEIACNILSANANQLSNIDCYAKLTVISVNEIDSIS